MTSVIADYKGQSKKQQQERFILLFVGAYEEKYSTCVPSKEVIVAAAHRAGVYDGNFSKYISLMSKYMVCPNGTFKLNPSGRTEATKISGDVDDSMKSGFDWNSRAKSHRKVARASKDEKALVKSWVDMNVDIGKVDVKALGALHQAMFALWSLTTCLKVVKAVKPMLAYMYLIQKHTTVSAKQKSFSSALSHERNQKLFGRNAAGEYYLTSEAEKEVAAWCDGKANPTSHKNDEDEDE